MANLAMPCSGRLCFLLSVAWMNSVVWMNFQKQIGVTSLSHWAEDKPQTMYRTSSHSTCAWMRNYKMWQGPLTEQLRNQKTMLFVFFV